MSETLIIAGGICLLVVIVVQRIAIIRMERYIYEMRKSNRYPFVVDSDIEDDLGI